MGYGLHHLHKPQHYMNMKYYHYEGKPIYTYLADVVQILYVVQPLETVRCTLLWTSQKAISKIQESSYIETKNPNAFIATGFLVIKDTLRS